MRQYYGKVLSSNLTEKQERLTDFLRIRTFYNPTGRTLQTLKHPEE